MAPASTPDTHEGGRGIRDQIQRYRTAFISLISMVLIAAVVGGYILAHERLSLPGWVPVLGHEYFTLKGEFRTGQALTPGQGQTVTIAGAKIGEISSVDLNNGVALVSMNITPKYAHYIHHNATMLMRPKTNLKDMVIEVDPGTPDTGQLKSGAVIPLSQTAPDVNLDEFLASLDGETRALLQELLAGAGQGLGHSGRTLAAVYKRFDPAERALEEIGHQLQFRHQNISHAIHNFQLLLGAIGSKDQQLAEVVHSSNQVFRTFASEEKAFQRTLHLLPGALTSTEQGLGKLAAASRVVAPTLTRLEPFAHALAPALRQFEPFLRETTPVFKNEIRPFARQILPVVRQVSPSVHQLSQAFPDLRTGFSVFSELLNEFAYNPGPNQAGFLFFLLWANHNFNSVTSLADAHGTLGHTLLYFNCEVTPLLSESAKVNPDVNLLIGLLKPPTPAECTARGLPVPRFGTALAAHAHAAEHALAAARAHSATQAHSAAAPSGGGH